MNGDALGGPSPALPGWCLYPLSALLAIIIGYVVFRMPSRAGRFVILACWFRYMMGAYSELTFAASPVGPSWNALGSMAVFAAGVILLRKRMFFSRFFAPLYLFMLVILLSSIVNGTWVGLINNTTKLGYFAVIAAGSYQALADIQAAAFFPRLLWAFSPPVIFQAASLILGISKQSELDRSASYIGGYHHEAVFSVMVATFFLVVFLAPKLRLSVRALAGIYGVIGIVAANYRTTMLAVMPLLLFAMSTGFTRLVAPRQRLLVAAIGILITIGIGAAAVWIAEDRFSDLAFLAGNPGSLIKEPEHFSSVDRAVLSGRPYIWSQYIYGYLAGSSQQHWVGFGPDSWAGVFPTYAHNTLVSYLYEYGILGVVATLFLWACMFRWAWVTGRARAPIVAAHSSFLLLNMATMPQWQIEGQILYGLVCGYTLYMARKERFRRLAVPGPLPARSRSSGKGLAPRNGSRAATRPRESEYSGG